MQFRTFTMNFDSYTMRTDRIVPLGCNYFAAEWHYKTVGRSESNFAEREKEVSLV